MPNARLRVLVFLVFAAPPYLTAYVKTGNPVYPFLSSSSRTPSAVANFPLTPGAPYDLTFHTSRLPEVQDGAAGFQYFLFLHWQFCCCSLTAVARTARISKRVGSRGVSLRDPNDAHPTSPSLSLSRIPLATVAIAAAFAKLRTLDRTLYRIALGLPPWCFS